MSNEFTRVPQAAREVDLTDVWRAIVASRKRIGIVTLVCVVAATLYVLIATPKYAGEAKVLVENQEGYLTRQERGELAPDEAQVASQVQVLMSRDIAREAVRKLKLMNNSEFDPVAGAGGLIRQIGDLIAGARLSTREERIFEEYYKRLTVVAMPKSRVVSVEFLSRDPALAARGANVISDLYIQMQADAKRQQARGAAASLGLHVAALRTKVAEAEGKVEAFRAQSGLMVGANNSLLPTQTLAEINTQLATARTAQADSQARARLLREALRNGRLNEVPDIANNELVRRVSEQRVTLRGQLALESRTLGPEHPRTKDLNAQIASVEAELRALAEKTSRTLENDARIAGSRVDYLVAAIDRQKRAVGGSGDDEVKLRELEREARLIKEQLELSTARWQEAIARETSQSTPGDARVISRAVEPEKPSSPKKVIVLFAAIGGLAMSVFGVVTSTMMSAPRPTYRPPTPVYAGPRSAPPQDLLRAMQQDTGVPSDRLDRALGRDGPIRKRAPGAGAGVKSASRPEPRDSGERDDSVSDFAARIMAAPAAPHGTVALVVAVNHKTAYDGGIALARRLTKGGRTVLADLSRGPAFTCAGDGLSDVIDGRATFARAIQRDPNSRLHIINRGRNAIEAGEELENIVAALARTYDFVVLTVAGEEDVDLALGLAGAVERCALVQRAGVDPQTSEALADALTESGAADLEILDLPLAPAQRRKVNAPAA